MNYMLVQYSSRIEIKKLIFVCLRNYLKFIVIVKPDQRVETIKRDRLSQKSVRCFRDDSSRAPCF